MYCKNCGNQLNENAVVCLNCGAGKNTGGSFCSNCGSPIGENAAVCLNCGANTNGNAAGKSEKSKTTAGLLAIFLGHLGIHWFYLGFKNKGIVNIALTVASALLCFLMGIGVLAFIGIWIYNIIIAVQIFTGKQTDPNGNILN